MLSRSAPAVLVCVLVVAVTACSSNESDDSTPSTKAATSSITTAAPTTSGESATGLVTEVVSHETTQDIWVTAPGGPESDGWGTWPVVFLLHGRGGDGEGLALTAEGLANQGMLVFSASYRFDEPQYIEMDAECSYRYVWTLAEDYGGDLNQPVTTVGHSMGAGIGLYGEMNVEAYGPGGTFDGCFTGTPRSDLIVPIAGCYYEFEGNEFDFETSSYSNYDTEVLFIVGTDDHVCEAWQSRDAADTLQAQGFDARLVELDGGNHANVVFYEIVDDQWLNAPNDPIGDLVVEMIVEAIEVAGQ